MSIDDIVAHYRALLAEHGNSPEAVQYRDAQSQLARFRLLARIDADPGSVLDFGCGLGHLGQLLRAEGFTGRYLGLDIVPDFVDLANAAFAGDAQARAMLCPAPDQPLPGGHAYGFVSGVFNNAMPDNTGFLYGTLRRLWDAVEKGIAFNTLSTHVDYRDPGLFYVDPLEMFAFLKTELGAHVQMHHDYILSPGGFPYEVTFYARKAPVAVYHRADA